MFQRDSAVCNALELFIVLTSFKTSRGISTKLFTKYSLDKEDLEILKERIPSFSKGREIKKK